MGIFRILFGSRSNIKDNDSGSLVLAPDTTDVKNMNQNVKHQQPLAPSQESQLVTDKFNVAAQLMRIGEFELCIDAYENIAKQHPKRAEECESQIGAALYFLGRYDEAMNYYNKAHMHDRKRPVNSKIKEA